MRFGVERSLIGSRTGSSENSQGGFSSNEFDENFLKKDGDLDD